MLSCHAIRCVRGERFVFDGLGFSLKPGAALLLAGPNGSGKTSLLRIMAGLLTPEAGEVSWMSHPVYENPEYQENMVFIGHQNALKPELSVYDNIQFWAAMRGTEMLAPAAMQFFNLLDKADTPVGELSSGWQKRVALARLLATPALIWLLDEPTANLDAQGIEMLKGLIETRVKQGGIVVFSSHDPLPSTTLYQLNLSDFMEMRDAA